MSTAESSGRRCPARPPLRPPRKTSACSLWGLPTKAAFSRSGEVYPAVLELGSSAPHFPVLVAQTSVCQRLQHNSDAAPCSSQGWLFGSELRLRHFPRSTNGFWPPRNCFYALRRTLNHVLRPPSDFRARFSYGARDHVVFRVRRLLAQAFLAKVPQIEVPSW